MRYHLLKHSSRNFTTSSFKIHFSIINHITPTLCNRYTKTQSYMQCGTMLVRNLVGRLGVHDKTDHKLEVKSL